ncbi:uncharacterized protein AMSG_00087 [Thecamonas trahens ATCC 50062]|uniref:OTU domain-containing protein n=1 Tax=Thecamonas trahens ATCC 50062 TaxID=461836 RepID=A0A0L0D168_THETB|nr:hypothetical protein AMSG_00087 [Thecamonas trahens ATCC 50062]KNC45971.1 hypothetical protein AMSG_00087 [Thecamonas trahens ATCC 50062]|eukprot:XP_013762952.1 hypothetical protein AMSG_00087 [Thecamonas trahens ATCC 50062]
MERDAWRVAAGARVGKDLREDSWEGTSYTGKSGASGASASAVYARFGETSRQTANFDPRPKTYRTKAPEARAKWLPSSDVGGPAAPTPRVTVAKDITSRFEAHGLTVYRIAMDGNCLFRSFGFQLPGWGQGKHAELRAIACDHMRKHSELFAPFCEAEVDSSFEEYLDQMSKLKTWGGEPELSALAHHFRVTVVVYDAYTTTSLQVYNEGHQPVILLCKSNGHYNAVIDNDVLSPTSQVFTPGHRNLAAIMDAVFPESQPTPVGAVSAGQPAFAGPLPTLPATPIDPAAPPLEDMFVAVDDPEAVPSEPLAEESLEDKMALRIAEWTATLTALEDQDVMAARDTRSAAPPPLAPAAGLRKPGGKRKLSIVIPTKP